MFHSAFNVLAVLATSRSVSAFTPFGNSWCGKPYEPYLAPADPGGQTPTPSYSATPLLDLSIQPRYNLYLESESSGSFLVNVPLSHYYGTAYTGSLNSYSTLHVVITVGSEDGKTLATGSVQVNSTANEIPFALSKLKAQTSAYNIYLTVSSGSKTYTSTTLLYFLPNPSSGSVAKVDNLYQSTLIADATTPSKWNQFFPYGWYADSSITSDPDNANAYLAAGYNFIHFVPDDSKPTEPFTQPDLDLFLDRMDEIGLYLVYDMRGTYMNSTLVESQVSSIKSRKCLLMWYTADEPDGWSYPLNSTQIAYNLIKSIDPYHPVSLVLNCIDFYYEDYTLGADIVLEDAYPVGINATFSTQFGTPCTWDQGDCGCDGCIGSISDVSTRIDLLRSYQQYYNQAKPIWAVPQAFGNQTYWVTIPTGAEEVALQQVALNHHAMGISSWIYPSDDELNNVTSLYATALTSSTPASFLLNSIPTQQLPVTSPSSTFSSLIDVSSWDYQGRLMVGIVNDNYSSSNGTVTITLPRSVTKIQETIWGSAEGWSVKDKKLLVKKNGLKGLEVDVLILG